MYKKLKTEMFANDIDQQYICKKLKRSQTYITQRMMGRKSWSMDDVYALIEILRIPFEQIHLYFPKGGKEIKS
jgi:hypothetical protein